MTAIANRRAAGTDGPDYYPTPAWATRALLSKEQFEGLVHEPCCGAGAISSELSAAGLSVVSSDLFDHGFGQAGVDARTLSGPVENIITNPPYNIASDLLPNFVSICERKTALLLRFSFLESARRYPLFLKYPPARVYVFSERLSMSKAGEVVKGGGTVSYGWFVWERGWNAEPAIRWLPPGLKPGSKHSASLPHLRTEPAQANEAKNG